MTADRAILIIGTGSWGTALALLLAGKGERVLLYARRREMAEALRRDRENRAYLSGFPLPDSIEVITDLFPAAEARVIVLAVPSVGLRATTRMLAPLLNADQVIISTAKGLETETGMRMSQVFEAETPIALHSRLAALSGPNLAREVAGGIASATVIAAADPIVGEEAQDLFTTPTFRVYTNPDRVGVELGGALKHVIAIGAGVNDGLGFGDNTKATLVTRGLAEMTRLGVALGARTETFHGLSGVGDLMATCAGSKSRNHRVGFKLGQGRKLEKVLAGMGGMIAEGVPTTRATYRHAQALGVELPITEQIYQVLFEGKSPRAAVADLMSRQPRGELEEQWSRSPSALPM